jgi:hypothetical protein
MNGLGRIYAPDDRDRLYRIADVAPATSGRTYRYWFQGGWYGDQGQTPECVAYSTMAWLADGPVTHPQKPMFDPDQFFKDIGGNQNGALVRDSFQTLKDRGVISEYRWALSMDEVMMALLEMGPLVIGITWFNDMFEPDAEGLVHPGGGVAGGHAIEVNGINTDHGILRLKNSWGREWGINGDFHLTFDDFEYLVFGIDGEAVLATELR